MNFDNWNLFGIWCLEFGIFVFVAFLKALSVYLGTVIGVGIFSLPFISLKAGFFLVTFYLLGMTCIIVCSHLIYSQVVLGTEERYRLTGYVKKYLGSNYQKITFVIFSFGLTGALLAYLIVGGQFLNYIFSPYFGGNSNFYTFLFFALGAYLVFRDIKSISAVELFLVFFLLAVVLILVLRALPFINFSYFKTYDSGFLFFPYGAVLFSLWGSSVIPEIEEIFIKETSNNKEKIRRGVKNVILWGTIFSAVIYFLFIAAVLGVSGPDTSKEGIFGLYRFLGSAIVKLGFIFGVLACFTSFLTIALTLKKIFWFDFKIPKNLSWAVSCFLPLLLFILGAREFIKVISLTGAVALGLEGIIIVLLYKRFLKEKLSKKMNPLTYLLTLIFIIGIFSELFFFLTI